MTLDEFANSIVLTNNGPGAFSAVLQLPPDLSVFSGHFPGKPILPGIAYVFLAENTVSRFCGKKLSLVQLKRTKFFQPTTPGITLNMGGQVTEEEEDKRITAQVVFTDGNGQKVCLVKMVLEK